MADYDEGGNPVGRPKIPLDWKKIETLCKIQCTGEEIASVFSCSYDTLAARCKADHGINFSEYISEKRLSGRTSLRRYQWKSAEKGNIVMQIWLGKNLLGQKDKTEPEGGETATPIAIGYSVKEAVSDVVVTNARAQ